MIKHIRNRFPIINILRATLLAFLVFAAPKAVAQNVSVYVSSVSVYYTNGSAVCPNNSNGLNVSNHIEVAGDNPWTWSALIEFNQMQGEYRTYNSDNSTSTGTVTHNTYPGACLTICGTLSCTSASGFGIDRMFFEVYKYADGTNPENESSAPALRTFYNFNIEACPASSVNRPFGTYCTAWDGSYNLDGEFGRTNGNYGFRATVETNYVTAEENIAIKSMMAYPAQNQYPIQVDVVDIHCVQSTPAVVGSSTPVAAAPYNITYRISKDALVSIGVFSYTGTGGATLRRVVLREGVRVGEGTPEGTLQNGDSWDGRDNEGRLLPAGNYIIQIDAYANDEHGRDDAYRVTRQISIDPLQMTDFSVSALEAYSTSQAYVKYVLTESATVYTRIYPNTCSLRNVNGVTSAGPTVQNASNVACAPLRSYKEEQTGRTYAYTYWDGRTDNGDTVDDGTYLVVQWAEIPNGADGTIYTGKYYQRTLAVSRGYVGVTGPVVSYTSMGSSPTVNGMNPFYLTYALSRASLVTARILTHDGTTVVRTLISSAAREGTSSSELWDGKDSNGYYVSSGVYTAEIRAQDYLAPSMITRKTAVFPVDMFRVTDVSAQALPHGSSDYATISYIPSQTMHVTVSIYKPGTVISNAVWPPSPDPDDLIISFSGVRPGRSMTTVVWDGIYNDNMAPDGEYVYTVVGYSSATLRDYEGGAVATPIYATDRTVGHLTVARGPVYFDSVDVIPTVPSMSSSSETVTLPPYEIAFTLPRIASVTIQAVNESLCLAPAYTNNVCRNIEPGAVYSPGIINTVYWDGRDDYGNYLYADAYTIQLIAYNYPNTSLQPATTWYETVEMNPFKIYDMAISDISYDIPYGIVSYQTSVPMKVAVQIFKPGTTFDPNGNPTPVLSKSLVKAIAAVRPPFTSVTEVWDGTDRTLTPVPDGLYPFRLVTSTDTSLIDSNTGEISNRSALADIDAYVTPNVIAVSAGESSDPCGDFSNTTSFFPNPLRQSSGTFRVTKVPVAGNYAFKIYNLPGDLIYEYDWGYQVPGSAYPNLEHVWKRENASGRKIARGVYFAVMELKSSQGSRQVCQTVKKILVP